MENRNWLSVAVTLALVGCSGGFTPPNGEVNRRYSSNCTITKSKIILTYQDRGNIKAGWQSEASGLCVDAPPAKEDTEAPVTQGEVFAAQEDPDS